MSQMTDSIARRMAAVSKLSRAARGYLPGKVVFVCGTEVVPVNRATWKSRRAKSMKPKAKPKRFKPQPKVVRATSVLCSDAQRCSHASLKKYPVTSIGRKAPTCPGIYFIYQEKQLIYVGQASKDLRSRLSGHEVIRIIGRWEPSKPLAFSFIAVSDPANLSQVELHFIRSLKPVLNSDPFENIAALNRMRAS